VRLPGQTWGPIALASSLGSDSYREPKRSLDHGGCPSFPHHSFLKIWSGWCCGAVRDLEFRQPGRHAYQAVVGPGEIEVVVIEKSWKRVLRASEPVLDEAA